MAASNAEPFDDHRYEPEDFLDRGERVVVKVRRLGRGKGSGIEIAENQWHVLDFRGQRIVRFRVFVSEIEALEAAVLRE